ncbi:hypothetical protein MTO96_025439 [Rhipicephalus appendiculatus]
MVLAHVCDEVVLARELARAHVAGVDLDAHVHRVDVARKVFPARELLGAERATNGVQVGMHLEVALQSSLVHKRGVTQVALVTHPRIGDCVVALLVPDECSCIVACEVTVAALQEAHPVTFWKSTV